MTVRFAWGGESDHPSPAPSDTGEGLGLHRTKIFSSRSVFFGLFLNKVQQNSIFFWSFKAPPPSFLLLHTGKTYVQGATSTSVHVSDYF